MRNSVFWTADNCKGMFWTPLVGRVGTVSSPCFHVSPPATNTQVAVTNEQGLGREDMGLSGSPR